MVQLAEDVSNWLLELMLNIKKSFHLFYETLLKKAFNIDDVRLQ